MMSESGAQDVVFVISLLNDSDVQKHPAIGLLYFEIIILFSQLFALPL